MLLLIIIKTTVIKIITVNKEDSDENYQNEENSGFCLKSISNVINNIPLVVVDLVSLLWTLNASIFWIALSRSCKNTKPYPIFLVLITQKSFQNKNPLKVSDKQIWDILWELSSQEDLRKYLKQFKRKYLAWWLP